MAIGVNAKGVETAGPDRVPGFPITYPLSCILTCAAVLRDAGGSMTEEDVREYGAIISKYAHSLKATLLDGAR